MSAELEMMSYEHWSRAGELAPQLGTLAALAEETPLELRYTQSTDRCII